MVRGAANVSGATEDRSSSNTPPIGGARPIDAEDTDEQTSVSNKQQQKLRRHASCACACASACVGAESARASAVKGWMPTVLRFATT